MTLSTNFNTTQEEERKKFYISVPSINGTFFLIFKQQAPCLHFAFGLSNYVADFSFKDNELIHGKSLGIMPGR